MKKKVRTIVVGDKKYGWLVAPIDSQYVCLRVWHPESKSAPWFKVKYRFDDPWLNFKDIAHSQTSSESRKPHQMKPIQPKHVAQFISTVLALHSESSEEKRNTLNFLCEVDGQLTAD